MEVMGERKRKRDEKENEKEKSEELSQKRVATKTQKISCCQNLEEAKTLGAAKEDICGIEKYDGVLSLDLVLNRNSCLLLRYIESFERLMSDLVLKIFDNITIRKTNEFSERKVSLHCSLPLVEDFLVPILQRLFIAENREKSCFQKWRCESRENLEKLFASYSFFSPQTLEKPIGQEGDRVTLVIDKDHPFVFSYNPNHRPFLITVSYCIQLTNLAGVSQRIYLKKPVAADVYQVEPEYARIMGLLQKE